MRIFKKYPSNCVNLATTYFPILGSDRLFSVSHASLWVRLVGRTLKTGHVRTNTARSSCACACVCVIHGSRFSHDFVFYVSMTNIE